MLPRIKFESVSKLLHNENLLIAIRIFQFLNLVELNFAAK